MPQNSFSDDFPTFTSHLSALDLEDHSPDAQFEDTQFHSGSSAAPDTLTKAYMTSHNLSSLDIQNSWIADSGANKHMSHNFQWFSSYKPLPSETSWPITAIAGHQCYVAGTGTIKILVQPPHKVDIVLLENVLYVLGLQCNLFSTTLMATKHSIHFIGTQTHCHFVKNHEILFTGRLIQDMYILDFTVLLPPVQGLYTAAYGNIPLKDQYQTLQLWHHRLGHLHYDMIKKMAQNGAVTGLHLTTQSPSELCSACQFGKMKRQSFPESHFRTYASHPGDLIHGNICGPMSQPSKGGSLYFVLYQDDSTGYRFVFCVTRRSEALTCFQQVFNTILRDTGRTVSTLRTDRDGEFSSTAFLRYLSDNNIRRELTTSYTPEQNAVVERSNRTIMEGVRSSLYHSQLPLSFWAEAVVYIVYTLNRTCSRVHGQQTPFELYTGIKPSLSHLCPFGCPVYVYIPAQLHKKLDAKSRRGIFVGYSDESKGYRVWDPTKKQVVTTRDLVFDERAFLQIPKSSAVIPLTTISPSPVLIPDIPTSSTLPNTPPPLQLLLLLQIVPQHNLLHSLLLTYHFILHHLQQITLLPIKLLQNLLFIHPTEILQLSPTVPHLRLNLLVLAQSTHPTDMVIGTTASQPWPAHCHLFPKLMKKPSILLMLRSGKLPWMQNLNLYSQMTHGNFALVLQGDNPSNANGFMHTRLSRMGV